MALSTGRPSVCVVCFLFCFFFSVLGLFLFCLAMTQSHLAGSPLSSEHGLRHAGPHNASCVFFPVLGTITACLSMQGWECFCSMFSLCCVLLNWPVHPGVLINRLTLAVCLGVCGPQSRYNRIIFKCVYSWHEPICGHALVDHRCPATTQEWTSLHNWQWSSSSLPSSRCQLWTILAKCPY